MVSSHSELRVLLIQARNDHDIEIQEIECFLERCRLLPSQLHNINLPTSPKLPSVSSALNEYDALFIGGSGDYSAVDDHEWMPFAFDLIKEAYKRYLPTFGSCWGHQVIARALGGKVVHDPDRAEMGCHHVDLTPAAKVDQLFKDFPDSFHVNMGHHDRITQLPDLATEMARNENQPFEAFRMNGRPIYGTQFHSELDARRYEERIVRYRDKYEAQLSSQEVMQSILDSLKETSPVDHLMFDFLSKFAVAKLD